VIILFPASTDSAPGPFPYKYLATLVIVSALLALGMLKAPFHQQKIPSIFKLGYLVGPATESLLHHRGLQVCTEDMGTPGDPICFRSARMPLASVVLASGVRLFGDRPATIAAAKTLLCMVPLWAAMGLVLSAFKRSGGSLLLCAGILILPFLIVNYLVVITGMEVEEGYLFGLIPLALALIACVPRPGIGWAVTAGITLDLIYIAKSSMLLAVFVLLVASLLRLSKLWQRVAITVLVALAPLSWAVHQRHASGRYSLGTSLDGINLHKGNNAEFRDRYPISNSYLDSQDPKLNRGLYFTDEWSFNDYHMARAREFLLSHPLYTAESAGRKLFVILLSTRNYTVTKTTLAEAVVTGLGMVLFRLILWSSLVVAVLAAFRKQERDRFFGITYLAFVAAYCAPYIVGFGFTRHAIVLVYPAAVFCALSIRPSSERIQPPCDSTVGL